MADPLLNSMKTAIETHFKNVRFPMELVDIGYNTERESVLFTFAAANHADLKAVLRTITMDIGNTFKRRVEFRQVRIIN